jgi:hypothetical protein
MPSLRLNTQPRADFTDTTEWQTVGKATKPKAPPSVCLPPHHAQVLSKFCTSLPLSCNLVHLIVMIMFRDQHVCLLCQAMATVTALPDAWR